MARIKLRDVTVSGTRLDKLKALAEIIAEQIDGSVEENLAPLVRQYRETIKEIEDLEGEGSDDEIGRILSNRRADGKPGAVRKNRAKV